MLWHRLLAGIALLTVTGCGATPPTQASGRPVSEWLEALRSREYRQRLKAVQVLGNVGNHDPAALPALAQALKDGDPRIRDAAVLAIMKSGADAVGVAPAVEAAVADPDPGVSSHAAAALKRITGKDVSR
jgi:HEAT repeat protein